MDTNETSMTMSSRTIMGLFGLLRIWNGHQRDKLDNEFSNYRHLMIEHRNFERKFPTNTLPCVEFLTRQCRHLVDLMTK